MDYMKAALAQARRAVGNTSPNPSVGAVLVKDGRIVGRGFTQPPGQAHAEVKALEQAGPEARGAALYVTLEPCCHYGRTPPCTDAIVAAGVSEVHMAMMDSNPRVDGRGKKQLEDAGIKTFLDSSHPEAFELLEGYSKFITSGTPFVIAKYAMTLDGKIASYTGDSRWITGEDARRCVHDMRKAADAIMVGINTLLYDDPQLTARDGGGRPLGRQPLRVIVDSRGRAAKTARVFSEPGRTLVAVASIDEGKAGALREKGAELLFLPGKDGRVDLSALLLELGRREVVSVLVEGGGTLLSSMFKDRLVDKVAAFISPLILGGKEAITPVEGDGIARVSQGIAIEMARMKRIGKDCLLVGYPNYRGEGDV